MFHVEVNLIYICYLVNFFFLMRPSGDQPDVPCGPRGEKFAHPSIETFMTLKYGLTIETFTTLKYGLTIETFMTLKYGLAIETFICWSIWINHWNLLLYHHIFYHAMPHKSFFGVRNRT